MGEILVLVFLTLCFVLSLPFDFGLSRFLVFPEEEEGQGERPGLGSVAWGERTNELLPPKLRGGAYPCGISGTGDARAN